MKINIQSATTVALLAITVLVSGSCKKSRFNPFVIETLPEFSVIMDNGETVNTMTLYGSTTIICTFNTKDGRSVKMLSMLQSLYEQYRRKVKFVTISDGEREEDIIRYWSDHGYALPFSSQEDATQAHKFSQSIPYVMVVGDNMEIAGSFDKDNLPTRSDIERLIGGSAK